MSRKAIITLIQLAFLALAITCGALGARKLNARTPEVAIDLVVYAQTLTERALNAIEKEQELRDQGLEEEIYTTTDERLNAEYDWKHMQGQLKRLLTESQYAPLAEVDFYEQTAELEDRLKSVHFGMTSKVPVYILFTLAALCMVLALVSKKFTGTIPAAGESSPSTASDSGD